MNDPGDKSQPLRDDARLNELEVKLTFAEDLLETLNAALHRQQLQIDRLQREVRELRQQVAVGIPAEARNPQDEIPPHY
jgi:SlyX protein